MSRATLEQQATKLSNILVVDDDPSHLLFLGDRLIAEGYVPVMASNGEEALKMIELRRPNLILLDIMMPGMDGMEVLSTIKEDYPGIPVVMVTALLDEKEGERAFKLGAFDYITKPVNIEYLKVCVLCALVSEKEKSYSFNR